MIDPASSFSALKLQVLAIIGSVALLDTGCAGDAPPATSSVVNSVVNSARSIARKSARRAEWDAPTSAPEKSPPERAPGDATEGERGATSSATSAKGKLPASVVRRVIRMHTNQVRHCFELGARESPDLGGRLVVEFKILSTGKVDPEVAIQSSIGQDSVDQCVVTAIKGWKFPEPEGGEVVVVYPFTFEQG